MNILEQLTDKKLASPPYWLPSNCAYLTQIGSVAYAASTDTSDYDVYGFCIPKKEVIFPHLAGVIQNFGNQGEKFDQYQQHHIFDIDALGGKGREYDFTIYNIVKYFQLVMENNPSCLDSLFTSQECVLHMTEVGNVVRENRKMFLHKGSFAKFKGYAMSQCHKMKTKDISGERRMKFGLHLVRLLNEAEMILVEGDIDLRRNNEHLKAIRRGEVTEDEILKWASDKERHLENLYHESKLQLKPDEAKIKELLLNCLEHHYGSLDKAITLPDRYKSSLYEIRTILELAGI